MKSIRNTTRHVKPASPRGPATSWTCFGQTTLFSLFKTLIFLGFIWLFAGKLSAVELGARIQAKNDLNVRDGAASSTVLFEVSGGQTGVVVGGPTTATLNGTSYEWWRVLWHGSLQNGWSIASGLEKLPLTKVGLIGPGSASQPGDQIQTLTPNLEWHAHPSASRYGLYVSEYPYGSDHLVFDEIFITGTSVTLNTTPSVIEPGKSYRWQVNAFNGSTEGPVSDLLYFTVPPDTGNDTPRKPDDLIATPSASSVILTWQDRADNEDGFVIERSLAGSAYLELAEVATDSESFTDSSVSSGSPYRYRIAAFKGTQYSEYVGPVGLTFGLPIPVPAKPGSTVQTGTQIGSLIPTFCWSSVNDAEDYQIEIYRLPNTKIYDHEVEPTNEHQLANGLLGYGESYRWRVRAKVADQWESFSEFIYFHTAEIPGGGAPPSSLEIIHPTEFSAYNPGSNIPIQIEAQGDLDGIESYLVEYKLDASSSSSWSPINFTAQPTGPVTRVNWPTPSEANSTRVQIRVVATDRIGTQLAVTYSDRFRISPQAGIPTDVPDIATLAPETGVPVTLSASRSLPGSGATTIAEYHWDFGDESPPVSTPQSNVSHTFSEPGNQYTVTLTVTNELGNSHSQSLYPIVGIDTMGNTTPQIKSADPVNLATGNFLYDHTDLEIPGIGLPFRFRRFYNSKDDTAINSAVGNRWRHSYQIGIESDPESFNLRIRMPDGNAQIFESADGSTFETEPGNHSKLRRTLDGGYELCTKDQIFYKFIQIGSTHKLAQIHDRNENRIRINYENNQISSIIDTAEREIHFNYDHAGRLVGIVDPLSRTVQYSHDEHGNLQTVRDLRGQPTSFTYDSSYQLITATDPNGNVFVQNVYDDLNRVVTAQRDALDHSWNFTYNFLTRITTVTDPNGHQTNYAHDLNLRVTTIADPLGNITRYQYDTDSNRTAIQDANGNLTTFTYDDRGNMTLKTDPYLNTTAITYNQRNDPTSRTDALGNQTVFNYDSKGNQVAIVDSLGRKAVTAYWGNGLPRKITDRRGSTTKFFYDENGLLNQQIDSDGSVTEYLHDDAGRTVSFVQSEGETTTFQYNSGNLLVSQQNPLGQVTQYEYDNNGNQVTVVSPAGDTTIKEYDAKDRLISITDPTGKSIQHTYDPLDRKLTTLNRRGYQTEFAYDSAGRMTSIQYPDGTMKFLSYDANGNRTSEKRDEKAPIFYEYDANNRIITTTNAFGHQAIVRYDSVGNRIAVKTPESGNTLYQYTPERLLAKVTDAAGKEVIFSYDEEGNMTSLQDLNGQLTLYNYDSLGNISSVEDSAQQLTSYTYDNKGNLESETTPDGITVNYTYNANNQRVKVDYPDHSTPGKVADVTLEYSDSGHESAMNDETGRTAWEYNKQGQLTKQEHTQYPGLAFQYDSNGNRRSIKYPNGNSIDYSYDSHDRLISITDWLGNPTQYEYDGNNLIKIRHVNQCETEYTYESSGKLTKISHSDSSGLIISTQEFQYNETGKRSFSSISPPMEQPPVELRRNYSINQINQIDSLNNNDPFRWDSSGNLLNDHESSYEWNIDGRLASVTSPHLTQSFVYDGKGHRVQLDNTVHVWDHSVKPANMIASLPSDESEGSFHIFGVGLAYSISSSGDYSVYHYNATGSTIASTDSTGRIISRQRYDPFGRILVKEGQTLNFGYLGQHGILTDSSGLLYIRARYYSPDLGRFISIDPKEFDQLKPQSINRYHYAFNQPFLYADIDGNEPITLSVLALAAATGAVIELGGEFLADISDGSIDSSAADYLTAATGGAVGGVAGLFGGPVAHTIASALTGNLIDQVRHDEFNVTRLAADTAIDGVVGIAIGKVADFIPKPSGRPAEKVFTKFVTGKNIGYYWGKELFESTLPTSFGNAIDRIAKEKREGRNSGNVPILPEELEPEIVPITPSKSKSVSR